MVAILGYSRAPAIRFATNGRREITFERLLSCLDDLGGVPKEILTDRDTAFVVGQTSQGAAIFAPEWVDLCGVLATIPRACRPYRAKTKGKVERMVRELKESFIPWLSGKLLPPCPTLGDYDRLARRWIEIRVLSRRHRTTDRLVGEAWFEERQLLAQIPPRILAGLAGGLMIPSRPVVVDTAQRAQGEHAQIRSLAEYELAQ
jgi:transposase